MLDTDPATCFANATLDVLEAYLESPAGLGEFREISKQKQFHSIAVIVGITGSVEGRLLIEVGRTTALGLCQALNLGEPFPKFDRMARSTLGELANLVAGKAVSTLFEDTCEFSITPPVILCGSGIEPLGIQSATIVPIETSYGPLTLNLAVRPKG